MTKYISKGEWFDAGTEAVLLDDYRKREYMGGSIWNAGLFEGYRNGHPDQEICTFDEFEIIADETKTPTDSSRN